MIGLTLLVIAMIASYSGAFAKPTLHHMTVAVAAPGTGRQRHPRPGSVGGQRSWRRRRCPPAGLRAQERRRVRRLPDRRNEDLRRGRRWTQRRQRRRDRRPRRRRQGGADPAVEDVAPASAGDPSGTVEFYAIIFISIGASVGATVLGRLMGTVRRPLTLALRSATLAGYSALLAVAVTVYVDVILGALTGHTCQLFGALWLYAMAVGGVVTGVRRHSARSYRWV